MNFPKHIALYLEHNDHACGYETVEHYLSTSDNGIDFESPESRQRCIDTNELWTLQWYPDTPVGFCKLGAPTLEELLAYLERAVQTGETG